MTDYKTTLTDNDKATLRVLLEAIAHFTNIRATMPMQSVNAYLCVALNPGLQVSDYARMGNVSPNLMSRYLKDLGHTNRYGEPSFDLVATEMSPVDRRCHQTLLTQRGLGLALMLVHTLRKLPSR